MAQPPALSQRTSPSKATRRSLWSRRLVSLGCLFASIPKFNNQQPRPTLTCRQRGVGFHGRQVQEPGVRLKVRSYLGISLLQLSLLRFLMEAGIVSQVGI